MLQIVEIGMGSYAMAMATLWSNAMQVFEKLSKSSLKLAAKRKLPIVPGHKKNLKEEREKLIGEQLLE